MSNRFLRLFNHIAILSVLPLNKCFDDLKQAQPLPLLRLFIRKVVRVRGRVIDERGKENCTSCRQRLAGPPQMKRRGMPAADRLLPARRHVDRVQRQRHLDQLLAVMNKIPQR